MNFVLAYSLTVKPHNNINIHVIVRLYIRTLSRSRMDNNEQGMDKLCSNIKNFTRPIHNRAFIVNHTYSVAVWNRNEMKYQTLISEK